MKILTSSEMKEIDRKAIEEIGIPGPVLMENAGLRILEALKAKFSDLRKEKIMIVAGKGNNGGDGLVVARHLFNGGCRPIILLLASKNEVGGDAAVNLRIVLNIGLPIMEITSESIWKKSLKDLNAATIIVDAIFGTGLIKPAKGFWKRVIEDINRTKGFKLAVDIPSGLSSDHFEPMGPAVRADLTVALAAPKISHIFPPTAEYVGELTVADIGIPPFLFDQERYRLEMLEEAMIRPVLRKRPRDSHKGTYGHLLVVAGSLGKTGAAVMAGKAALKCGAGLVTIAAPKSALPAIARSMMELMTEPLPETTEGTVAAGAVGRTIELLQGKNALLIGPGLSTNGSTVEFLSQLLPRVRKPVVVDADGLNILALRPVLLDELPRPCIMTPHPGEFARLCGLSNKEILSRRLKLVPEFSRRYGIHLVLKGYRTLIGTPEGWTFVNPTGNPGMATGGTGDVLSGMIASLLIQEKDVREATSAAVYLHGLSGDIAADELSERALVAGDLIKYLPRALKKMEMS